MCITFLTTVLCYTHIIATDHWISPNVSGDIPPPVSSFTLSNIANEKALLYGGNTAQGRSSELRVATVLGGSVVSVVSVSDLIHMYMKVNLKAVMVS